MSRFTPSNPTDSALEEATNFSWFRLPDGSYVSRGTTPAQAEKLLETLSSLGAKDVATSTVVWLDPDQARTVIASAASQIEPVKIDQEQIAVYLYALIESAIRVRCNAALPDRLDWILSDDGQSFKLTGLSPEATKEITLRLFNELKLKELPEEGAVSVTLEDAQQSYLAAKRISKAR